MSREEILLLRKIWKYHGLGFDNEEIGNWRERERECSAYGINKINIYNN